MLYLEFESSKISKKEQKQLKQNNINIPTSKLVM